MSLFTDKVVSEIEEQARFFYLDRRMTGNWNKHRRGDELRLVTGWTWVSRRDGSVSRTGFKTRSAALRDAFYVLIQHREQPADVTRPRAVPKLARAS